MGKDLPVKSDVPIEKGVEPICKAINEKPGLKTHFSCEGHPPDNPSGYVALTCDDQKELRPILSSIPPVRSYSFEDENENNCKGWVAAVAMMMQDRVAYRIEFGARSERVIVELREEVTEAIREVRQISWGNVLERVMKRG